MKNDKLKAPVARWRRAGPSVSGVITIGAINLDRVSLRAGSVSSSANKFRTDPSMAFEWWGHGARGSPPERLRAGYEVASTERFRSPNATSTATEHPGHRAAEGVCSVTARPG